jgi:hypothetical protein
LVKSSAPDRAMPVRTRSRHPRLEGKCWELARLGYSRDGKKGKRVLRHPHQP